MMPTVTTARHDLASMCPEPIEAAVLAHKATGGKAVKRLFGSKDPAAHLGINNWLVLTPSALRLYALGGRTGVKPRREVGAWPRAAVRIELADVDRSAFFASTGSSLDYRVHRLHVTGPEVDLLLDVRAAPMLFGDDQDMITDEAIAAETDPEVREGMIGLRQMADETLHMLSAIVTGVGRPVA